MAAPDPYDEPPPWADEPPPDYDDGGPAPSRTELPASRGGRGREIPHDDDVERALLGALLLSGDAVTAVGTLVTPADYYVPRHQAIATAIAELAAAGEGVDPITTWDRLDPDARAKIGGLAALIDLQAQAPPPSRAAHYAGIIARHARHRRTLTAATALVDDLWSATDPDAALVAHRTRIDQLGTTLAAGSGLRIADVGEILDGDVVQTEATLLERSDGRCMFYAGMLNTLQAEPSTGKSWVACVAIMQVLDQGGAAVYLDWEDSPTGIIGRLLTLGGNPDAIRTRFRYARVETAWGAAEHTAALDLARGVNADLVVLDGVADAMAHDGFDENDNGEVTQWANRVPRPIAWQTGAAVVMLDHVTKASDKTNRYARGAGAKLAIIDGAAYRLDVVEPYSRHRAGRMSATVAKDRNGSVGAIGEVVAHLPVTPLAGGERTTIEVDPPPLGKGPGGTFMPTKIMVRLSSLLEEGPKSPAMLHAALARSKPHIIEQAIGHLVRMGHAEQVKGMGSTHMLKLVTPYHDSPADADEPPPSDDEAQQALALDDPNHPAYF